MPPLTSTLTFIFLLLTWWITNNIYAVDAELLFRNYPTPHLYIDLTLFQTLLGIFLTTIFIHFNPFTKSSTTTHHQHQHQQHHHHHQNNLTVQVLAIGFLHFLGTLFTNLSYSLIGSTTTLMWKLTEPCSAIFLKRLVLQQFTTPTSIIGVFITLSGVLHFSSSSFTFTNFSPIILSNLVFPTRNVFIKLSQNPQIAPIQRFLTMLITASPLCFITFLIKSVIIPPNLRALPYIFRNALLFNAYQIASFLLLQTLDPLTHSLLNTLKRFSAILVSMLLIHTPFQPSHFHGISITIVGFSVYLIGSSNNPQKLRHHPLPLLALFSISCLFIFSTPDIQTSLIHNSTTASNNINIINNITQQQTQKQLQLRQQQLPYVVRLGHEYSNRRKHVNYTNYEDALQDDGNNVGNLIWQYGAHEALPDFTQTNLCQQDQNCTQLAATSESRIVHYLPVACMMDPTHRNVFKGNLEGMRKNHVDELLLVGLGIQVDFIPNSTKPDFLPGHNITYTTQDYPIPQMTKDFFNLLEQRGGITLLRGDFTHGVIQRIGFTRAYSVGCPSFWINEDIHLGKSLQEKYQAVAKRIGDATLKVAVNVKMMHGFSRHLKYIRDHYPLARFYCQGISDLNMLKNHDIPFERARLFRTVEHWMADLQEMDVSYGLRIHGNMIALGAGLPVLVVAPDWRVLELVRKMKIPHFTIFDDVFRDDVDVARLVKMKVDEFDGEEFDRNRCEIAKVYTNVFSRYGIGVKEHVKQISELC